MTKQRLEGDLQQILKKKKNCWYTKLQVNPLAHCKTVGDFLLLTNMYNHVFECKQCSTDRIDFRRLTQLSDMYKFHLSLPQNNAWFVVCFWKGTKKNSIYAIIPVSQMNYWVAVGTKKSINVKDIQQGFLHNYQSFEENINGL